MLSWYSQAVIAGRAVTFLHPRRWFRAEYLKLRATLPFLRSAEWLPECAIFQMKEKFVKRRNQGHEMSCNTKLLIGLATLFAGTFALPTMSVAQGPINANPFAGSAYAMAEVQWNVQSEGWILGNKEISDDGGNYNSAGIYYPLINVSVNWGDIINSRHGTITWVQHFSWTGNGVANQPIGRLVYSVMVHAAGGIEAWGQSAHAKAQAKITSFGTDLIWVKEIDLPAGTLPVATDSQSNTTTKTVSSPTSTDWVETAIVEADATTP